MRLAGFLIGLLLFAAMDVMAQETYYKFWIQLSDKKFNESSTDKPEEFLSLRAIERRNRQGIAITEQDLPVSSVYLDSLTEYPLRILFTSKWMNAVVVRTVDSSLAEILPYRSFITGVDYLYRYPWKKKSAGGKWIEPVPGQEPSADRKGYMLQGQELKSDHQSEMLQGQYFHQMGYEGQDMLIAVLDAGFYNADSIHGFDSLFMSGRLLGTRSFVEPDSAFFWKGNGAHGTNVLSIMGGIIEGEFRGTAPKAGYWLIETEDIRSEFRIEEANWLAGAELADSAGADVINSSLGSSISYTDPLQNYTYSEMNGKTALVTRAATLAASKGILVVTSAGNEGKPDDPWTYITAPADAENLVSVGAVRADGTRADFSSRGPSYDGRAKPDVMAQGEGTTLIGSNGLVTAGNGTSFSSPVLAGLAACLWQKNPDISNNELLEAIRTCSSLNPYPDNLYGYGVPNLSVADFIITGLNRPVLTTWRLNVFPNPCKEVIFIGGEQFSGGQISGNQFPGGRILYRIHDIGGRICTSGEISIPQGSLAGIPVHSLAAGTYFISIKSRDGTGTGIFNKIQ